MFYKLIIASATCATLTACIAPTPALAPEITFMTELNTLCGKAFEGKVVSTDEVDNDFASQRVVMHVRDCSDHEVRIPLHVGENRSRTWVLTRDRDGLELRHDHRHEDGEPDAVTQYGGFVRTETSTEIRSEFPADAQTKSIFDANNISVSNQNVWAVEVRPKDDLFAYELRRPNRFFRLEFDLSAPVETPPAAWGFE